MSIFKLLESNITKNVEDYSDYLSDKKGDALKGAEFMFYALSNIFKDKAIEDIEAGIVDSSYRNEKYDFGIDAIYITASSDFVEQPEQLEDYNDDTKFKIHVFQFKRGAGISQADLLKLNKGIKKVLIDESVSNADNQYFHDRMITLNEIRNYLFTNFSTDNISVICHIAFGGLEKNIRSENILSDELDNITTQLISNGFTNCQINITDCQTLINAPSKGAQIIDIIEYQKTFKYITETDDSKKLNGFISIINGKDIAELVRKYQTSIFEANIRDYYRRSDLNSKITETSSSASEAKFFWSYNNGLTMTCRKVEELPGNKYRLHDLQIVNGCQTSNAIYAALKNKERIQELQGKIDTGKALTKKEKDEFEKKENLQFNDNTNLLIKIIETSDDDFIYKITETTNSQTPIKAFSLRANDDIQKLIEKYLDDNGIAYERRINYLRNKGKKNIYSIQKLFQLYTSQVLFKPSQVKTRPKSMFINTYDTVFPAPNVNSLNYAIYLIPIKVDIALQKGIIDYLKTTRTITDYKKTLIAYGKLHLGCFMLSSVLKSKYNLKEIVNNETNIIKDIETNFKFHFIDALTNFEKVMKRFAGTSKDTIPISIRKSELDIKIARFCNQRT